MPRKARKSTQVTKKFADNLSDLVASQKDTGLSQKQIAEGIGVSSGSLSEWCSDYVTATIDNLAQAAKYFGVSADYLIGLSEFKPANKDSRTVHENTGLSEIAINKLSFMQQMGQSEEIEILSALIENPYFCVALQQAAQYLAIAKDCKERDSQLRAMKDVLADDDYYTLHAISDEIIQTKSGVLSRELQAPEIGTLFKLSSIDSLQSAFKDVLKGLINNGTNR